MWEKLTDIVVDEVLSAIGGKTDQVKDNEQWKKLFVDTGKFLSNNLESSQAFYDDLVLIFSADNMKILAEKLKGKSGFKLNELIHLELYSLMQNYEVEQDCIETYIHHFMQIIFAYIEENNPTVDTQNFLAEWRKQEDKTFNRIEIQLEELTRNIKDFNNRRRKGIFTIDEIDVKLHSELTLPLMGLDFYEIDDEEFLNHFHKSINQECIYVVGKSKEETTYCILNEIRKMNLDKPTLIVTNEEEWERLINENVNNNVLIPSFYAGSIRAISGNVNIFIFGEEESCSGKQYYTLRRRTRSKLSECLRNAGMDYEEVNELIRNTNGLYVPMKKRLFKGAMYEIPSWKKANIKVLTTALLCQKWTECDGDKLVIEDLSNMKYEEFITELKTYMRGENPFVIEINGYRGKSIQLASIEEAWEELDNCILSEVWNKFVELVYEVLIESEPIFEYPFDKHFEASVYAAKPEWSSVLKHGMLGSLIMRACYRKREEFQNQVNKVVKKILDTISTKQRWGYIAEYITDLCEAAPDIIITRLEQELKTSTGMIDLFNENQGDLFTARNYYTHILWAVEELLVQKQYVIRAIRWLWQIDALNIKYHITNSPKSILETIFCAWINMSALSVEEKIENVKWAMSRFENAWEIIYSELPTKRQVICSTLNKPHYRDTEELSELTYNDVNTTYLAYIHACIENINKSAEKWNKIISNMSNYYDELIDEIFSKLQEDILAMNDKERIQIKEELRNEIYRHRYFSNAKWAMNETKVVKFEDMLNKIKIDNPIYEYGYLFKSRWQFPLLHPIPYTEERDDEGREKNGLLVEEEIKTRMKEFEEKGLSLKELLLLVCQNANPTIGRYIAKYYGNRSFDKDILGLIMEIDLKGSVIYDYICFFVGKGDDILKESIEILKQKVDNIQLISELIRLEIISNSNKESCLIVSESEEIKKEYWSGRNIYSISNEIESCLWAISECRKYGNINSYLMLIYDKKEVLKPEELYNALIQLKDFDNECTIFNSEFYLEEILKIVQENYIEDDGKSEHIATIEWLCRDVLPWENMRCVQRIMKKTPKMYAMLVEIIYLKKGVKKDNTNRTEAERNMASAAFDIFHKAHFCPAEREGKVDYEELKKWVDDFKNLLIAQEQEHLFGHLVGRLLAYSPIGKDNYMPCEAVRRIIDEEIYDEDLMRAYYIEEENKRGVYTLNAGKPEKQLSIKYKQNADAIRSCYPKTAIIYDQLSSIYESEANYERRRAEDEW